MHAKLYLIAAATCGLLYACNSGGTKKQDANQADTARSQPKTSGTGFNGYVATIPEATLPYRFTYKNILTADKLPRLELSKLKADQGQYYEPDPDATYAQLPGAYQGAVAYPLFKYTIDNKLTAVAYTFQKGSSSIIYYPFVELLVFNADGKIKGRQVIASGSMDAEHVDNTTFSIVTPTQVNMMTDVDEYADSTRNGEPLRHLEDKKSFSIQSDGKITSNKP
ncbi:hypothetical protein HH214_15675 [Mucilaginibacter robiniae]|uniref:Lipoprotein n=1 Tax=Mucilaginibacter robiniae TaxID=2728022 RepID=A0A7L5E9Z9_9SPHI|nr:hypothetical protein [Mucilaginibacter robiniae]QJD97206.1 hypothetical protein HH214_15675 [Mucilaginibacter robiniae]